MKALQTMLVLLSLGCIGTGAFAQEQPKTTPTVAPPPPPPPPQMATAPAATTTTTATATTATAVSTTAVPTAPAPINMSKGDVIDFASAYPYYTTFLAATKAAEMVDSLKFKTPITVFMPTNTAFSKLPAGTVENLLKPENKAALTNVLGYHVIAGAVPLKEILGAVLKNKGTTTINTVTGGVLTFSMIEGKLKITDEKGGVTAITLSDMPATNGLIHVTDNVLLPK